MEIRLLEPADAEVFRDLRLRALREAPGSFTTSYEEGARDDVARTAALFLRNEHGSPDDFALGAFEGGSAGTAEGVIVGTARLVREERRKVAHRASLRGMFVAPEAQGRGVGRALVDALVARARTLPGLERINLTVMADNDRAIRLYTRCGFTIWGREPLAMKRDGKYSDELWMGLAL